MAIFPAPPFTLVNGTTADASQVMANFLSIVTNGNANCASAGANTNITSLGGLTTPITIAQGGTGAATAALARAALGAAAAGVNADITSLTGLTTPLLVSEGGTGGNTALLGRQGLGVDAGTGLTQSGTTLSVNYGTTSTTAAAGNDSRITGAAQKSANLSDLVSKTTSYTNLIVGSSGAAHQGILGSLTGGSWAQISAFGGCSATFTSTGVISVTLGATALAMGYVIGQASENAGSGDGIAVCPPTGTLSASNSYTFNFRNCSSKVLVDADRVLLLFY